MKYPTVVPTVASFLASLSNDGLSPNSVCEDDLGEVVAGLIASEAYTAPVGPGRWVQKADLFADLFMAGRSGPDVYYDAWIEPYWTE